MIYDEMSDFEINRRVAFGISKTDFEANNFEVVRYFFDGQHLDAPEVFDPCNSPADAWPVIVDNNISLCLNPDNKQDWFAFKGIFSVNNMSYSYENKSENPLRAAMIVYLMMEDAK